MAGDIGLRCLRCTGLVCTEVAVGALVAVSTAGAAGTAVAFPTGAGAAVAARTEGTGDAAAISNRAAIVAKVERVENLFMAEPERWWMTRWHLEAWPAVWPAAL